MTDALFDASAYGPGTPSPVWRETKPMPVVEQGQRAEGIGTWRLVAGRKHSPIAHLIERGPLAPHGRLVTACGQDRGNLVAIEPGSPIPACPACHRKAEG